MGFEDEASYTRNARDSRVARYLWGITAKTTSHDALQLVFAILSTTDNEEDGDFQTASLVHPPF